MAVILNVFGIRFKEKYSKHNHLGIFIIPFFKCSDFHCCITVYHITFYAHTHCNARLVPLYLHTVLPQSNTLCPLQLISLFMGRPSFKMPPNLF